jgi:hypothetical protein
MALSMPFRRRWPRYSLRTLFVVVTLFAAILAYHVNWIRQRNDPRSCPQPISLKWNGPHTFGPEPPYYTNSINGFQPRHIPAPWTLRLFGEPGYEVIIIRGSDADVRQFQKIFPEAEVMAWKPWDAADTVWRPNIDRSWEGPPGTCRDFEVSD